MGNLVKKGKNIIVVRSMKDYINREISDEQFKKSVIVYCRVSTKGQIDGSSLDTQQRIGEEYFFKSKTKFENLIVFREEGKSGDDFDISSNMGVMRELLGVILYKVEKSLIKHLWVYDSSRLSRSTELSSIIYKTLGENECDFYINNEKKNINDLDSGLMLKILTIFDEYENNKRFQKSTLGKIEHLKKNKWYGGNYPFGFQRGKESGEIIINNYESKYVRKIFKLFNSGNSIKDLIIFLNVENVKPPKSDKTVWNEGTLRNMLRNEIYIGKFKVVQKLIKHKSKEYCIEKDMVVEVNQRFPIIIRDTKLFNDVQLKMEKDNSKINKNRNIISPYLLSGIIYCGNCGNSMKINSNKTLNIKKYWCNFSEKNWKYIDNRYNKCGKGSTKQIDVRVVDNLIWNEVLDTFKNSYIIKEQFKNSVLPNRLKDREEPVNQIKSYNKSISIYKKKIKKLKFNKIEFLRQKLTLKISEVDYLSLVKSIDEEIDFNNTRIVEKNSEIEVTKNGIVWYDWLEDFDKYYNQIKSYNTIEDKKKFINQFVEKISVFWDNISNTHKLVVTFNIQIVKDTRIKKEKYVFKVLNGQNDKVINDINSQKIRKQLKHFSNTKTLLSNHSTVTECFDNNENVPKNSNQNEVEKINVEFDLIIRTSKLTKTTHYTTYQQKLYRLVKFLKEERGIGYRRISHILTEKGYRSVRTKSVLKNNYIYSIYKKGKIREKRIERSFDSKIDNLNYTFRYFS